MSSWNIDLRELDFSFKCLPIIYVTVMTLLVLTRNIKSMSILAGAGCHIVDTRGGWFLVKSRLKSIEDGELTRLSRKSPNSALFIQNDQFCAASIAQQHYVKRSAKKRICLLLLIWGQVQ